MRTPTLVAFCGIAVLLGPAGCDSNKDKDRDDSDSEKLSRREGDARSRGMDEIPRGATEVEGGEGRLEYEPSRDGVIYVYDVDHDQVIYVARVRDRERFRLDPEGDRATINTRTVFRGDLNPRHRYRLYFDRAG
jgi:hypothetical protein